MDPVLLPTQWANYLSMLGFALLALLVWRIPKQLIYRNAPDESRWRDIRIWASALISVQLVLYATFT